MLSPEAWPAPSPRASSIPLAQGPSSGFAGWLCSGWLLPGWPMSLRGAGVTWPCSRVPIAVCTFQSQAQTGVKNSWKSHVDLLHVIISIIFPLFPPFFPFFSLFHHAFSQFSGPLFSLFVNKSPFIHPLSP